MLDLILTSKTNKNTFFLKATAYSKHSLVVWSLDFYGSSSLNMILIAYSGVARYVEFIPTARVPILQYVSNHFGISCDVSINNYPGQIKSRILYWICTMDERFGDMVLLVSSM